MSVKRLKYCVDNEWRESKTKTYKPVMNPSTGKQIAETPYCTPDEVNEAILSADAAYPAWKATPVAVRTQIMFRFRELVIANLKDLAVLLATEMGKNLAEAEGDVYKVIEACEAAVTLPMEMQGHSLMNATVGHDTVLNREPLGVFVGIVPYNFPAMIPFGWFIPICITCGNTMVLKPAIMVPQTGMRLLELLIEAGMPKGVVNFVPCDRSEIQQMMAHPLVKGVSFVGSAKVGVKVYAAAAAAGKRVQVLGEAKNHALVMEDAPIEWTAQRVLNSAFGCAGQRCMALPTIVVHEAIADEFVATLKKLAEGLTVGAAYEPATKLGPVITAEHKKSVHDWIEKGVKEGAKLVLDGRGCKPKGLEEGFFVGATILDHVKPGMSVGVEEIFGPVVCIKRVKSLDEGIEVMNANPLANGSIIFTQSGYYAREFVSRTDGGMVGVNVGIPVPLAFFPFSGNKGSFFGDQHTLGRDGMRFYTRSKTVTSTWPSPEADGGHVGTWEGTINKK